MSGRETETQGVEVIQVPLRGFMVPCTSVDDAVDVGIAEAILSGGDVFPRFPVELDRLAMTLEQYGRHAAAEELKNRADRVRAAAFI